MPENPENRRLNRPRVSVLMSLYNQADYVREALDGILSQSFDNFEFVVVDDASTDAGRDILAEYAARHERIVPIRNEKNIGLTRSLNRGLRAAQGEFIARQDADDVSEKDRLRLQVEYLDRHPETALVGSSYHVIDSEGNVQRLYTPPLTDTAIRWQMLFSNPLCHSSVVFRKSALEKAGSAYDESLQCSQDMDLWARLMRHGAAANLPQPLVRLRKHGRSVSVLRAEEQERVGAEISFRFLPEIAPNVPLDKSDFVLLREYYRGFSSHAGKNEMLQCGRLFDLFDGLAARPGANPAEVGRLRKALVRRLLHSAKPRQLSGLLASGLLRRMAACDPVGVLGHPLARMRRRMWSIFSGSPHRDQEARSETGERDAK